MFPELKKKEHLFSFQKLNKYFFLPFFIPLVCFSGKFFSETMKTDDRKIDINDVTLDNTHTFAFLYKIIQALCQIIGGLSYFITRQLAKTRRDSETIEAIGKDSNSDNVSASSKKRFRRKKSYTEQKKDWKMLIILLMPFGMITYNLSIVYAKDIKH